MSFPAMKTKLLRNVRKGERIQLPNDAEIYNVLKKGKGYGTTEIKITYGESDSEDWEQKTFTGEGELEVTLVD